MKLAIAAVVLLALVVAEVHSGLVPVQPLLPVNPRHTFAEWQRIFSSQTPTPERCEGCTPGTVPQPSLAGQVAAGVKVHDSRIIGGDEAARAQFPWQVEVRMDNSYFCGGSIISSHWILSAGHCAYGFSSFVIAMGSLYTQRSDPERVTASTRQGHPHENYDPRLISDDISVIKLPNGIPTWQAHIRPVRLPSRGQAANSFAGASVELSGWGRYGTSSVSPTISDHLRFVRLVVISNELCAQSFGSAIRSTNLCTAGSTRSGGPIGACNGDSGGALVVNASDTFTQVGIVSFGTSLGCNKKFPSAFTRVPSYLQWISARTGIAIEN